MNINVPVLMVTATYDVWSRFVVTKEVMNEMNRRIGNLTLKNLDCGHWMQHEKPDELNMALIHWLQHNVFANKGSSGGFVAPRAHL